MLESFGLMHTSVPLLLDAGRKQRCVFKGPTVCFLGVSICIYVCVCVCLSVSQQSFCLIQAVYTDWNHYYQLQLGTTHHNIPHNNYCY